MSKIERKPSDYFREQGYIGVEAEEAMLPYVAERFGSDKLLFASDYPHWDASDDPVGEFFETFGETLPATDQQNILCDTAASLYGLDLSWLSK